MNLDGECQHWRRPAAAAFNEQPPEEEALCSAPEDEPDAPPACSLDTGSTSGDYMFSGFPEHSFDPEPMSTPVDRTLSSKVRHSAMQRGGLRWCERWTLWCGVVCVCACLVLRSSPF